MISDRIGKIAKAQQYALESDRFAAVGDEVHVQGDHGHHTLSRCNDGWACSCGFFARNGWCAHTLAYEWYSGVRPH
jgi:hypothetical protein